jgi:hypothetical protein
VLVQTAVASAGPRWPALRKVLGASVAWRIRGAPDYRRSKGQSSPFRTFSRRRFDPPRTCGIFQSGGFGKGRSTRLRLSFGCPVLFRGLLLRRAPRSTIWVK